LVALAVGTFNVITGVVVLFATVDDKSVPVVPKVKAATDVTVPEPVAIVQLLSAVKSYAVPLIVNVLEEGTPPNPVKVYPGTFNTPPIKVDNPEDPDVVSEVNVAVGGVGIFNTLDINVAAPVPVVVKDVILLV